MFHAQLDHLVHQEQLRDALADVEREWLAAEARDHAEHRRLQAGLLVSALLGVPVVVYALSNSPQIAGWLRLAR
jgi:hypothetical protein